MAAQCSKCLFYDEKYDNFRQEYDDVIVVDNDQPPKHFCLLYESGIPSNIFYDGNACKFFVEK